MVALLSEKAEIQYNPEETNPEVLAQEIQMLGFGALPIDDYNGYQEGKLDVIVRGGGVDVCRCVGIWICKSWTSLCEWLGWGCVHMCE